MSFQRPETKNDKPQQSESNNSSQQGFAHPLDFLRILHDDYEKFASPQTGLITKDGVAAASANTGLNARDRLAAEIAYNHFDPMVDLAKMPDVNGGNANDNQFHGKPVSATISKDNLELDMDLYNGNIDGKITWQQVKGSFGSAFLATMDAALGGLTAASIEFPPLAAGFAFGTALATSALGIELYNTVKAPQRIRDLAEKDQKLLRSWSEINLGP